MSYNKEKHITTYEQCGEFLAVPRLGNGYIYRCNKSEYHPGPHVTSVTPPRSPESRSESRLMAGRGTTQYEWWTPLDAHT